MAEHFVASIKIERVVRRDGTVVHRDGSASRGEAPTRGVQEAMHITLKANSLERLKEKVKAHVDLVDEEDL